MKSKSLLVLFVVALAATVPAHAAPSPDQTPRFFIIIDRDTPPPVPVFHTWAQFIRWLRWLP